MVKNLTGIRGAAALWVVGVHYWRYFVGLLPGLRFLNPFFLHGYLGVPLFFCLSGFIMGYVYVDKFQQQGINFQTLRIFWLRRASRLYPIYILSTLAAALFYMIGILLHHKFNRASSTDLSVGTLLKNIFALQTWFGGPSLNEPSWSLSAELGAYLIFPILVLVLSTKRYPIVTPIALLFASIVFYEFGLKYSSSAGLQRIEVLTEFTMGLCCYLLVKRYHVPSKSSAAMRILLPPLIVILIFLFNNNKYLIDSIVPVLLLLLIVANYMPTQVKGLLSHRVFVRLGIWSYSIYLTHRLWENVMSGLGIPFYGVSIVLRFIEFALLVALPILGAAFTSKFIELPARELLYKKLQIK